MTGVTAGSAKADGTHYSVRLSSISNNTFTSHQGDADYWFSQGWVPAGTGYKKSSPSAGSTVNIVWNVKDDSGNNVSGAQVVMVLGKAYSCSTAVDEFVNMEANGSVTYMEGGNTKTSGNGWCGQSYNSSYAIGQTNASGNVTFSVKNYGLSAVKDQVAAWVNVDGNYMGTDSYDILDLNWLAPPLAAISKTFNFETVAGTPNYSQPYDSGDDANARTSVVTLSKTVKLGTRTSGKVLKVVRGFQDWSGFDIVSLQTNYSILSNDKPTVKFDVFNAQTAARVVLVKAEAGNRDPIEKRVTVQPGWTTVTVDFSTIEGFNGTLAQYARLDIFPTVPAAGGAAPGGVAGDVMYLDNVVFNTYITKKAPQAAPVINSAVAGTGTIAVTYTGIADAKNGGYPVTYQYRVGTGAWTTAPASPFTITGLTKGAKTVYMRAINIVNGGLASTKTVVVK